MAPDFWSSYISSTDSSQFLTSWLPFVTTYPGLYQVKCEVSFLLICNFVDYIFVLDMSVSFTLFMCSSIYVVHMTILLEAIDQLNIFQGVGLNLIQVTLKLRQVYVIPSSMKIYSRFIMIFTVTKKCGLSHISIQFNHNLLLFLPFFQLFYDRCSSWVFSEVEFTFFFFLFHFFYPSIYVSIFVLRLGLNVCHGLIC